MFPPNLRLAVDAMPLGAQIAVYAAVFVFTIAVLGASVAYSRKREKAIDPNNVLLPSYTSIADMKPVRDVVEVAHKLLEQQIIAVDLLRDIREELRVASRVLEMKDRRR